MGRKKQPWKSGDVFLVPTTDGMFTPGQVLRHEPDAMNSVAIVLFDGRLPNTTDALPQGALDASRIFSILLATRDLLDAGAWKVIDNRPVTVPARAYPYESLRASGFVGATITGSGIVEEFVNAYCGLTPWDDWHDPLYLDSLLVDPARKPTGLVYKHKEAGR